MVIMQGGRDNVRTNPTDTEITKALRDLDAHPVAPGVWTARLASGQTIKITDPARVDLYATVSAITDHLDERHGADRAEIAGRLMQVAETLGAAMTMWRHASGEPETYYSYGDTAGALADVALGALVAIASVPDGDPAAELAGAAARALARIGGAR